ncbi:MAG: alpha/beta fold hydrolase [Kofleriaceae bacterium]
MAPTAPPTSPAPAPRAPLDAAGAGASVATDGAADLPAPQPRVVTARDGVALAAALTSPPPGAPRHGAVLVVGAMGVPQTYYAPLARYLAGEGFVVLTFDPRGMGASRQGSLRQLDVDVLGWADLDAGAALAALEAAAPDLPLTWLGHSLGGQVVPFTPGHERLAKVVTVAAGSGYWRQNAPPLRRKVWLLWFVLAPTLTAVAGYFPGGKLGMVGDLPAGVLRQWRRWCLDPSYAVGVEPHAGAAYAAVTTPITALAFTDDEMMSRANIDSLHGFYAGAPVAVHHLAPADLGVARVGHFGAFRTAMREPLWASRLLPELARR